MRTNAEIMARLNIYVTEQDNKVYLVQDNYCCTLQLVKATLDYAKSINLTLPDDSEIEVECKSKDEVLQFLVSKGYNMTTPRPFQKATGRKYEPSTSYSIKGVE